MKYKQKDNYILFLLCAWGFLKLNQANGRVKSWKVKRPTLDTGW